MAARLEFFTKGDTEFVFDKEANLITTKAKWVEEQANAKPPPPKPPAAALSFRSGEAPMRLDQKRPYPDTYGPPPNPKAAKAKVEPKPKPKAKAVLTPNVEKAKGPAQPKPVMNEVTYTGVPAAKAGKAGGKGVPEDGVALRRPSEGKGASEGVPEDGVALRRPAEGKPSEEGGKGDGKTKAEVKADKAERKEKYMRNCSTPGCTTRVKWDHMKSWKQYEDPDDESEDAKFVWVYLCAKCMAVKRGCTEQEAMAEILRGGSGFKAAEKRNTKFKESLESHAQLMPALWDSKKGKKEVRHITRDTFKAMWTPWMEAIVIKTRHMFLVCEAQEERKKLIEELRTCTDQVRAKAIMEEMNELAKADRMVGFSKHDEETQDRFQLAATYSDEWVKVMLSAFPSYCLTP
jgi:hypothetical protein